MKCELYHDSFQNWKSYPIQKAQLIIADIPYALNSQEAIDEVYSTMGLEITFSGDATEDVVQGVSACR